jgi:hypothetical protein
MIPSLGHRHAKSRTQVERYALQKRAWRRLMAIDPKPTSGQSRMRVHPGINFRVVVTQDEPRLRIRANFSSGSSPHRQENQTETLLSSRTYVHFRSSCSLSTLSCSACTIRSVGCRARRPTPKQWRLCINIYIIDLRSGFEEFVPRPGPNLVKQALSPRTRPAISREAVMVKTVSEVGSSSIKVSTDWTNLKPAPCRDP